MNAIAVASLTPNNPEIVLNETWSDYDDDWIYGDYLVDPPTGDVTEKRGYLPGIARVEGRDEPEIHEAWYCHTDLIGTTRFTTDDLGFVHDGAVYTAFGEKMSGTDYRYGYAGSWGYQSTMDDSSGLDVFPFLHVGHRYYDPAIGRFLQRDPMGIAQGLNVYRYLSNTPTSAVDPSGLGFWDGDNPFHRWVGNQVWGRIHSQDTLANMSNARAVTEAVGGSLLLVGAGTAGWVIGGATGTVSLSVGSSGAARFHLAVGSSTAGWWHYTGPKGFMTASQLSAQFGRLIFKLPARYPDTIRNMPDNALNCLTGAVRGFISAL